jgi:FlaA1/EpsC-like NDP-sugar epimerase
LEGISQAVSQWRPNVIFHAAAHKHVPFMEACLNEAITNNVQGTWNVLQAAEKHRVERFVLISSDKAVNPTSVMGATKRLAELLTMAAAQRTGRAFLVVRFGNVLGSRGSVIPVFQRQIAAGGPLTVTHPDMCRYFMTIPEAVQLVLKASEMSRQGEVFVLDMGQPVRIMDLATDLIRLSGLEPGRDIEIVCTGIRSGEKLCEELSLAQEDLRRTDCPKIFVAKAESPVEPEALESLVFELIAMARGMRSNSSSARAHGLLPEICRCIDGFQLQSQPLPPEPVATPGVREGMTL